MLILLYHYMYSFFIGELPMPSRIHQLKTLFSQRLQWMQQHHYAKRSVQTHQDSLQIFSQWCYQHHILACHDLNRELLMSYKIWLSHQRSRQHKPWSLHYQRVLLGAIRQCLIWAFNRGDLLINPAKHLKLPKPDKTIINVLNLSQLQALLLAPDLDSPHGIRDRALLEVFYATALRRQEV
jgi:integrase/recombinase XerD